MPPAGSRKGRGGGEHDPDRDANDDDLTSLELRAVRIRELELKRARGEISCAECRRCVSLLLLYVFYRALELTA